MARRRLNPAIPAAAEEAAADVPRAEHFAEHFGRVPPPFAPADPGGTRETVAAAAFAAGPAPIARVAAEAAGRAALDEVVETLRRAEAEGRMLRAIPLDDIAADHIARDRMGADPLGAADEEMIALRESIRAHGQRMPIEVTPLRGPASDEGGDGGFARGTLPFGLISGWRRLAALRALFEETGEERFATATALIRRPASAGEAYVAMVEENEIRLGLSQYERARIAAVATERGVFPSEKAALLTLFANASRAKRSRIRAFTEIYHALDGALGFPAHLPERLGLRLVELIRAGRGDALVAALVAGAPRSAEAELDLLERTAARLEAEPGAPSEAAPEAREASPGRGGTEGDWSWERLGPGLELGFRDGGKPELRLRGAGVTAALREKILAALRRG
ncbi:ParB/RepB/Spo0J family partition protein [Amaricoccus solimangrovi]|uniref:ParB/RepB/Spo0J family partition protein n=1 Tax=Amaricoccus solimangrovi TaxID=2589815 RepID=UPI0015E32546|nr:nuclease [Amaricoccus solimangrovi]